MKNKTILLCIILAFVISLVAYATDSEHTAYELIVPLEYDSIFTISGDMFVTRDSESLSYIPLYSLYRFDGTKLLSGIKEISFSGDYILMKQHENMGVYSRDLTVIVPAIYKSVFMKDATHCVAIDGKEFLRPGSWWGDMYLYDLTTGKITGELGYGNGFNITDYKDSEKQLSEQWKYEAGGPAGVSISMNGDGWEPITHCKAYNDDGQLLLDFLPYCMTGDSVYSRLYYGCRGLFLYGYTGSGKSPDSMDYIFTGRGRLIAKQAHAPFLGLIGGKYICAFDNNTFNMEPYIMDRDGNIVIPKGTFDSYVFNYTTNGERCTISDNDGHIVVSKSGKYGIIALPDIQPEPSDWAKPEVTKAINKNLVPEDIRLWWKDCCTREEFCRMLSQSVKEITDKTIQELSAEAEVMNFSDCDDPDVLASSALGIVKGVGNNRFAPNRFITREQAAVMLSRAAAILDIPLTGNSVSFADKDRISDWAIAEVDAVSRVLCGDTKTPLMQGVGANLFKPQDYFTVEQSAITMLRLTEVIK